jgi:hypothetical protein
LAAARGVGARAAIDGPIRLSGPPASEIVEGRLIFYKFKGLERRLCENQFPPFARRFILDASAHAQTGVVSSGSNGDDRLGGSNASETEARSMGLRLCLLCLALLAVTPGALRAQPAPFDLVGPRLTVRVTHAGATLPISETPNLAAGDQLWIKADLPPGQSVHYLLIAAFLRGSTNPPPKDWFYRAETWSAQAQDGLKIVVPDGAQQVLVFLAPQTGGDFATLVNAVRDRPGAFVRASQDLNQATLDRSRLDAFLAAIRKTSLEDPADLSTVSPMLARSLAIKLDADCLLKTPELQAPCLTQGQESLVLNDGHSTSMVQALTSGNSAQLIATLSSTPQAGFGYYSPYVGAVLDFARIMDSLHTAHYQYIPALTVGQGDELSLLLNTPPSFENPKSVLVASLPAVEPPAAPPLQPVDPNAAYCVRKPDLVLPVEGAPLAFSTGYAHDMALRLKGANGQTIDLPAQADAEKGGFRVDSAGIDTAPLGDSVEGALHGVWGFMPFDGPRFRVQNANPQQWTLSADDQQSLIVGRDDTVRLRSAEAACVEDVAIREASGETTAVSWKLAGPDQLAVTVPLSDAQPGEVSLLIRRYGDKDADVVPLQAFAEAGHLDAFDFSVGDLSGVLTGARLDEVVDLNLRGATFKPGRLATRGGNDELAMDTTDAQAAGQLRAGETAIARVALKDGRKVSLRVSVGPPRPKVALISKSIRSEPSGARGVIQLAGQDEFPFGAVLTFSIRAASPAAFSGGERVEVADADGAVLTTLTLDSGLMLEDPGVAVATLDTGKAFNASTFGALRFRVVEGGTPGDWQPLTTLVRLPLLHRLICPERPAQPCQLVGSNLFLIDSLSGEPGFEHAVKVPEGFTGSVLPVPHPSSGRLYVKLRDDPSVVDWVSFPA